MPNTAISVKIPTRILEQMPAPGNGRSAFIVKAIEEKLAKRRSDWKPQSDRGRRMASLLAKGPGLGPSPRHRSRRFHISHTSLISGDSPSPTSNLLFLGKRKLSAALTADG